LKLAAIVEQKSLTTMGAPAGSGPGWWRPGDAVDLGRSTTLPSGDDPL
jgi:hypothetical protein